MVASCLLFFVVLTAYIEEDCVGVGSSVCSFLFQVAFVSDRFHLALLPSAKQGLKLQFQGFHRRGSVVFMQVVRLILHNYDAHRQGCFV